MMNLVERTDMDKLISAYAAATTAITAEDDVQLKAVAYAINSAANTGQFRTLFQEKLRPNVKDELESNGYKLTPVGDVHARKVIISWLPESDTSEDVDDEIDADIDEEVDDEL